MSKEGTKQLIAYIDKTLHEMENDIRARTSRPVHDYSDAKDREKLKKVIEDAFRRNRKAVREAIKRPGVSYNHDCDGTIQKRRIAATMEYLPEASRRFAEQYPDVSIDNEFIAYCASVPIYTFDYLDAVNFLLTGTAIWILDEVERQYAKRKLREYLPSAEAIEDTEIPEISDAQHSTYEIRAMVYLLQERNHGVKGHDEFRSLIDEASAKRTEASYTACDKPPEEMTNRERLNAILTMLRKPVVQRAVQRYKDDCWKYLDLFFKGLSVVRKQENELADRTRRRIERTRRLVQNAQEMEKRGNSSNSVLTPSIRSSVLPLHLGDDRHQPDELEDLRKSMDSVFSLMEKMDKYDDDYFSFCSTAHRIPELSKKELEEKVGEEIAGIFDGYRIGNPFETCFAYFYLLDSGDSFAWLYTTGIAVTTAACKLLPWATLVESHPRDGRDDLDFDDDEEWEDEFDEGWEDEYDDEDEDELDYPDQEEPIEKEEIAPIDWIETESELYAQKYTDACLWIDKENAKPEDLIPMSLPQIVAEMTRTLMPRNVYMYDDSHFEDSGLDESAAKMLEKYCMLAFHAGKTEYAPIIVTDEPQDVEENDSEDVAEQTWRLKQDVERLKDLLNRSHQETAEEKRKAEQILKDSQQEHAELLELRSMFSVSPQTGKPELKTAVTFPYTAKHRIVLFGGHASWLRAIRPLLKNVRIVEPEMRPNTSLFVNADCIWMQSNAMKHSDYYKIVNLARQYNIPVFYFQYASAEKCAEQLALEDEKFAPAE